MEDGKAVNKLRVLYEDNHVIVVVKEKNVLSQADNTHDIDMLTIIKKYLLVKLPVDYLIKFEKKKLRKHIWQW